MTKTVIGFVGGIASGKSAVAALFAEERPCVRVDADAIARRVRKRPAVRRALEQRFKTMEPAELARLVFRDDAALADLEAILHPPIRRAMVQAIRDARTPTVLVDAPLLQETGLDALCDAVVYVACPARTRRARARRDRGWTDAQYRARAAHQWSCVKKRARAGYVIDNAGDPARTRRGVRRVLRAIDKRG